MAPSVSFRDGTYRANVATAGKVYRQYRWHTRPATEGEPKVQLTGIGRDAVAGARIS